MTRAWLSVLYKYTKGDHPERLGQCQQIPHPLTWVLSSNFSSHHQAEADTMPFHQNQYEQQRHLMALTEHLRVHCHMDRQPVSKTCQSMIEYCLRTMPEDPLVYPVRENPFKEKRSCTILWSPSSMSSHLQWRLELRADCFTYSVYESDRRR